MGRFIRLLGANNLEIPIDGYLETQVEIMGHKMMASFVVSHAGDYSNAVSKGSRSPVLLGCNVLRKIACNPNCLKLCQVDPDWDFALRWVRSVKDLNCVHKMASDDVLVYDVLTRDT